jgi:hypothetical protein
MEEIINKSSMLYWFPLIRDLPIPQPRTEFVLSNDDWWKYLDSEKLPEQDIKTLKEAINRMGYPVFIRTDLASGKHQYLNSSYIDSEDKITQNLFGLIEQNALRDLWFDTIVVREFIYLDWKFKAFGGLPIAAERRYFIKDGKVMCGHSYWPEDAIRFYGNEDAWKDAAWKEWLQALNTESEAEINILTKYAKMIASVLDGAWSVDFARGMNGEWYFIDAAVAEQSWHPPCKNKLSDNPKGS